MTQKKEFIRGIKDGRLEMYKLDQSDIYQKGYAYGQADINHEVDDNHLFYEWYESEMSSFFKTQPLILKDKLVIFGLVLATIMITTFIFTLAAILASWLWQ